MIAREISSFLLKLFANFKAIAVVGPRQSGKTTLVKMLFPEKPYVSLENPDVRQFAIDDPRGFLHTYAKGAILDEIQRVPVLFSYLQEILDQDPTKGKFILTGSNHFLLQEAISQTLAGRIGYANLLPFSLQEIRSGGYDGHPEIDSLMIKGSYPPIYEQDIAADLWLGNYLSTYVERDVRLIKNIVDLQAFTKFIRLCAGRTGQLLNLSNLAIEIGVDHKTIQSWISVLVSGFIVYLLPQYHRNFQKRVVKMPKLYFHDTGLACFLLGIRSNDQLTQHTMRGAIFENWVINEIQKRKFNHHLPYEPYFWRDHSGHEVDLVLEENQKNIVIAEIKSGQTIHPESFKGLLYWEKISGADAKKYLIYAGDQAQQRSNGIQVVPWSHTDAII